VYLIEKLKEHGWGWFFRRVVREFIEPTTALGKRVHFLSGFVYFVVDRPIHFIAMREKTAGANDTLFFFYDFEVEPVTYDFLWALCVANTKRKELGLTTLQVVFVPGMFGGLRKESAAYEKIVDMNTRYWRIQSILLPAIHLLACTTGVTFCASRREAAAIQKEKARFFYPDRYNVTFPVSYSPQQAIQHPAVLAALRADHQALKYVSSWLKRFPEHKPVVVITLRQYDYTPERNSNLDAWALFAETIKNDFSVVFIPDTEKALQELPEALRAFACFDQACWNISLRAAIYQLAYLNLGVNTGPMSLCWLNEKCHYITFKIIAENAPEALEWKNLMLDRGFCVGKNPSFAKSFQKWVWAEDTFTTILQEFNAMNVLLKAGS